MAHSRIPSDVKSEQLDAISSDSADDTPDESNEKTKDHERDFEKAQRKERKRTAAEDAQLANDRQHDRNERRIELQENELDGYRKQIELSRGKIDALHLQITALTGENSQLRERKLWKSLIAGLAVILTTIGTILTVTMSTLTSGDYEESVSRFRLIWFGVGVTCLCIAGVLEATVVFFASVAGIAKHCLPRWSQSAQ